MPPPSHISYNDESKVEELARMSQAERQAWREVHIDREKDLAKIIFNFRLYQKAVLSNLKVQRQSVILNFADFKSLDQALGPKGTGHVYKYHDGSDYVLKNESKIKIPPTESNPEGVTLTRQLTNLEVALEKLAYDFYELYGVDVPPNFLVEEKMKDNSVQLHIATRRVHGALTIRDLATLHHEHNKTQSVEASLEVILSAQSIELAGIRKKFSNLFKSLSAIAMLFDTDPFCDDFENVILHAVDGLNDKLATLKIDPGETHLTGLPDGGKFKNLSLLPILGKKGLILKCFTESQFSTIQQVFTHATDNQKLAGMYRVTTRADQQIRDVVEKTAGVNYIPFELRKDIIAEQIARRDHFKTFYAKELEIYKRKFIDKRSTHSEIPEPLQSIPEAQIKPLTPSSTLSEIPQPRQPIPQAQIKPLTSSSTVKFPVIKNPVVETPVVRVQPKPQEVFKSKKLSQPKLKTKRTVKPKYNHFKTMYDLYFCQLKKENDNDRKIRWAHWSEQIKFISAIKKERLTGSETSKFIKILSAKEINYNDSKHSLLYHGCFALPRFSRRYYNCNQQLIYALKEMEPRLALENMVEQLEEFKRYFIQNILRDSSLFSDQSMTEWLKSEEYSLATVLFKKDADLLHIQVDEYCRRALGEAFRAELER